MKDSLIIYTKFDEQISLLSDAQAGVLLRALVSYQMDKELPKMDGITNMIFTVIRQQIDFDNQKYDEICEARREAGAKGAEFGKLGGRPPKRAKTPKTAQGVLETAKTAQGVLETAKTAQGELKTPKTPESESDNDSDIYTPLFIPPQGEKTNAFADKFFEAYPRYAKDRAKMRKDVDYKRLLEEFEKSSYLRSLYTVKQINDNYALIIAGEYRDKEKQVDGVTAGRELMAERERWYSAIREAAERKAEEIRKRFMQHEAFKSIETRLRELMPEMARLEVESDKGNLKAKQRLVKLTQEQGRLKQQRVAIIEANGMSEEDLLPKRYCKKCQDTGYTADGTLCSCYGG